LLTTPRSGTVETEPKGSIGLHHRVDGRSSGERTTTASDGVRRICGLDGFRGLGLRPRAPGNCPDRHRVEEGTMPNTWFPQRGFSRRLLNLVLASLLATATVVLIQGGPALAVDVPSVTDPAWPDKCGVDIVMVFDA